MTNKPTLATLKSFLKKNDGMLLMKVASKFDSSSDCVMSVEDSFSPLLKADTAHDANLGYQGVWVVRGSRDWISPFETSELAGFNVSNCCGEFTVAIRRAA